MNPVLRQFLSMSLSGSVLILLLLAGIHFLRDKISRQWQYYIWLAVILRLLLPVGVELDWMGETCQAIDQAIIRTVPPLPAGLEAEREETDVSEAAAASPLREMIPALFEHIRLIWPAAALGLLIRKITIYQSFIRYINAGAVPVSDMELLDRLSMTAEDMGVRKPVELYVNPLVSSPLLTGFFRPCIVLPGTDISEKNFRYIVLHELTHYRRKDMFYKWLVQVTVCLHWFNPLAHLMSREITRACEFSCDEAVLSQIGVDNAQDYGKTLLDAMAAVGKYRESLGAVTFSENKELLKERLGAIMSFGNKSKGIRLLTGILTVCIITGASFIGGDPASAAGPAASGKLPAANTNKTVLAASAQVEKYYEAGSLPLFQVMFPRLDEDEQAVWLEKIYEDGNIAFFSVGVNQLSAGSPLIGRLAERLYKDDALSFFSVLTGQMNRKTLESWLDQALEDKNFSFQAMLFDELDMDDELDALEEELAQKQLEEYKAVGVTMDGRSYYYQGKPVHVFLDHRPNTSAYHFGLNPDGTADIKTVYGADGKITGVVYMTEAEVKEVLGDLGGPDPDTCGDCEDDDWDWDWDDDDWDDDDWDWDDEDWDADAYAPYGITRNGKAYYYKNELVSIFLDVRPDNSCYTLDMNPAGTVNVKVIRGKDGQIKGAAPMTEAEAAELLSDMN